MVNWNLMTLLTTKLLLPLGLCFSVSFHLARIYFTSIYFRKILFSLWPEDVHVFFQDRYAHRELIPINNQISSVSQADVSVITMWLIVLFIWHHHAHLVLVTFTVNKIFVVVWYTVFLCSKFEEISWYHKVWIEWNSQLN